MRKGPDSGSTPHAPLRTRASLVYTRGELEEIALHTNKRVLCDHSWDFNGKFASGIGEGLATRITGSGPPTVAQVANTANGEVAMTLEATNQVQFAGVDWTDQLQIPANSLPYFAARVKTPAATVASVEDVVIGLSTAYNSTLNSISKYVRFRLSGSNALLIEGKDGTNTFNAQDVSRTLNAGEYNLFTIEQKAGDGRYYFFLNSDLVGALNLSAFAVTDLLQPLIGIRKASGTTVPVLTLDHLLLQWHRL